MSKLALLINRIFVVLVLLLGSSICNGQPPNPNDDPDPVDVPITGIEILIGLGGLLGIKKIHDLRKKR